MKAAFLAILLLQPLLGAEDYFSATMSPADQWEIRVDIDGDGLIDRIVSEPVGDFGQAGGRWDVYLGRKDGGLERVGEIWAHPLAVRIERHWDRIRIWVYWKGGGSAGSLGYYTLKKGVLSELERIEIFPGDGGTDLGNSIYGTVFSPAERCVAVKKRPNQALQPTAPSGRG